MLATDDRDPSTVLAWLFVVLLFPVLGLVAYFFIGRNFRRDSPRRRKIMAQMDAVAAESLAPVEAANVEFTEDAVSDLAATPGARIESVGRAEGGVSPLPADTVDIYTAGSQKFPALLAEMATAEKYIHLMYLIWEQDELTAKVKDVLLDRLKAGVKVHILYDWLSCISYKKDELKELAAAGAVVMPCYKRLPQINYRNHMKMVIIDGKSVYSGGMNMGQEYIDGGPRFDVWRDTSFRLSGPVVAPYLMLYRLHLAVQRRQGGPGHGVHAAAGGAPPPRGHAGPGAALQRPDHLQDHPRRVHHGAHQRARARLDPVALLRAGRAAHDRHVHGGDQWRRRALHDDRHARTRRSRSTPRMAYYPQLLRSGVKVYQYKAGFLHAKTVTVDDQLSHHRHLQLGHPQHHPARRGRLDLLRPQGGDGATREQYERDIQDCDQITEADFLASLTRGRRFRNSCYRLFSRLL